jgi:hypothetical protein
VPAYIVVTDPLSQQGMFIIADTLVIFTIVALIMVLSEWWAAE